MKNHIIVFLAKDLIFIIGLVGLAYWARQKTNDKVRLAASVIVGLGWAFIFIKIASKLYFHPRPFVVQNIQPLIKHSADNGFPSEHTTIAMAASTVLYLFNRRWGLVCVALTILVGLARVWARVHSPIDILAGLLLGALAGWLGYFLANYYLKSKQADK